MQGFLTLGKYLTLGFWALPLLALFGALGEPWNQYMLWAGVFVFFAHLGELLLVKGKLRACGKAGIMDAVMVILVGFFYWLPIFQQEKR
jgi:uncharacterized protein YhhL (DUF1145 family)